MDLGKKILELRKKNKLSQEQLAEKLDVTRQTISNWELNETTPDINQAKEISKIFNISLDDLVDNDVKNIVVEKISNTERLAGILINILKFIGIGLLVLIIIDVIALIVFNAFTDSSQNDDIIETELTCSLNDEIYNYSIKYYESNYDIIDAGGDTYINDVVDAGSYNDAEKLITVIEAYFENNGGTCN